LRNESFLQKKTAPPIEGEAMLMVPMVTPFSAKASYLFFLGFSTRFMRWGFRPRQNCAAPRDRLPARRKPRGAFALKLCGQTVDNQTKPMRLAMLDWRADVRPGSFSSHAAGRGRNSASADEKTTAIGKGEPSHEHLQRPQIR